MDSFLKLLLHGDPGEVLMLLIRLKNPSAAIPGCTIISRIGDIATCRVKRKDLMNLYNSPDILSVKAPRIIPGNFDPTGSSNHSQPAANRNFSRRLQDKFTGKGIYFAAIDWGFDFAHANLRQVDGGTRFKCIWNQNGSYDNNPYGYGCIYYAEAINRALQTDMPYQALGYHPGEKDRRGTGMHGTHVMDIAAGSPVVGEGGVAPGATLIGVELGNNLINGSDLALGDSVKLVEALDFILKNSGDAPCVVNMSLGSHGDSHTGLSLVEIAIDNFLTENAGYAIVQSVGNYFTSNCHLQQRINEHESYDIEWKIPARNFTPNEMEIWYHGDDELSIQLFTPDEILAVSTEPFTDIQVSLAGTPMGYLFHRKKEPNTQLNHIDIILDPSIAKGTWIVRVIGTKISNGNFHAYCERNDAGQARFSRYQSSPFSTTGSVCNSKNTITVGAYDHDHRSKNIVRFSSSGPTLLGNPKPDLVAPGYKILAAKCAQADEKNTTNGLTFKSGSSMAAPHVSGAIALLFEKYHPEKPPISKTKEILFNSLDPLPGAFRQQDIIRSGKGILNIPGLLNLPLPREKKNAMKQNQYIPAMALQEDYSSNPVYYHTHAPFLHESCSDCEQLLEEKMTASPFSGDGLSAIDMFFTAPDDDPFSVYRHFHPGYNFNYPSYEERFSVIGIPGRQLFRLAGKGDVILTRSPLSGKISHHIVADPKLLIDTGTYGKNKAGIYALVYSGDQRNGIAKIPIQLTDRQNRLLSNAIVVRKKYPGNNYSYTEDSQPAASPTTANGKNWCDIRYSIFYYLNESELDWLEVYDPKYPQGRYKTEGERDPDTKEYRMLERLEEYWSAVLGYGKSIPGYQLKTPAQVKSQALYSATDNETLGPWSAAFVSWVMKTSGVEESDGFVFSRRHLTYIVKALSNAKKGTPGQPFQLMGADTPVEQGDILCFNAGTDYTLPSLERKYLNPSTWDVINLENVSGASHCDIVKEIIEENGRRFVVVVGGNKSITKGGAGVTVKSREFELDSSNRVLNPKSIKNPGSLFGVIKTGPCSPAATSPASATSVTEDAPVATPVQSIKDYDPASSDTIVINMQEFPSEVPDFINYKGWKSNNADHNSGTREVRDIRIIKFIVLHETAGNPNGRGFVLPYTAHFVVKNNGIRQFNDLAEIEWHAGIFNSQSIGIEFANMGWSAGHGIRQSSIPARLRDERRFLILYWGNGHNIYELPAIDQLERLTAFLRKVLRRLDAGFFSIDRVWLQLISYNQIKDIWEFINESDIPDTDARKEYQKYFVFSNAIDYMIPATFGEYETGLLSHHSISNKITIMIPGTSTRRTVIDANAHPDGSFQSLYTWLRIARNYDSQTAFDKAKDLMKNNVVRVRTKNTYESWVKPKPPGSQWRLYAAAQKHNIYLLDIESV